MTSAAPRVPWLDEWSLLPLPEGSVVLAAGNRRSAGVRVAFPAPWQPAGEPRVDLDQVEQRWLAGAHRARVRHEVGSVWHLTVDVEVAGGHPAPPAPVLVVPTSPEAPGPPAWLVGAGSLGRVIVPVGRRRVLHWRQVQGDADVVPVGGMPEPGSHDLVGVSMLAPAALALEGTHRSRWRAEVLPDWVAAGAQLPRWLPASWVLEEGDRLVVPLADAAVTSDAATPELVGDATEVPVAPGPQTVTVAEAGGTTRLAVVGVRGESDDLRRRAERLMATDTRLLRGHEAWLLLHARHLVPVDAVLGEAGEDLAAAQARSSSPDPFAVATLATMAGASPQVAELLAVAIQAVERWRGGARPPGAHLAVPWVQVAALQAQVPPPQPLSPGDDPLDRLEHAVATLDADAGRPELERWLPALGAGLPGTSADPGVAVRVAALVRRAPGDWLAGRDLGGVLSVWERRLRAGSDRDAAWLLW